MGLGIFYVTNECNLFKKNETFSLLNTYVITFLYHALISGMFRNFGNRLKKWKSFTIQSIY